MELTSATEGFAAPATVPPEGGVSLSSDGGGSSGGGRADARAQLARYYRAENERRGRQIAALYELWRSLPDTETHRLLQRVTERAVAALDAHTCSLMLRDPGGDTLRMVASVGLPQDVAESVTLLVGERIAGRVAASGQPILVPRDPRTHPLLSTLPAPQVSDRSASDNDSARRPEVESALCTPLLASDGEVLGVLCLSRFVPANPFTEEDLRVFSLFAAQAGSAAETARLRDDGLRAARDGAEMASEVARHQRLIEQGRMAAAVAHELRNPLSSIKGAAQFLLREFGNTSEDASQDEDGRNATIRDFLAIVVDEVDGLGRLTSELIEFSSPSPPSLSREILSAVIAAEIAALREELNALGVLSIEEQYDAGMRDLIVEIDRVKAGGALRHVLRNAAQAAASQHNLREASRPEVRVGVTRHENEVRVTISDNGAGVSESAKSRLFEPFFTNRAKGLGLGLAQARQAIESQGGQLLLETSDTSLTAEWSGAHFVICLPLSSPSSSDTSPVE